MDPSEDEAIGTHLERGEGQNVEYGRPGRDAGKQEPCKNKMEAVDDDQGGNQQGSIRRKRHGFWWL